MKNHASFKFLCAAVFFLIVSPFFGFACEKNNPLSKGQTVYIPAYSHIYSGNRETPFLLTITISVRNIDPHQYLTITEVNYYDTQGKNLKRYIDQPVVLPLESLRYIVPHKDESGGSGANFIVTWRSDRLLNPPIVESIMIGTQNQQGVSFVSRGRVVRPTQ